MHNPDNQNSIQLAWLVPLVVLALMVPLIGAYFLLSSQSVETSSSNKESPDTNMEPSSESLDIESPATSKDFFSDYQIYRDRTVSRSWEQQNTNYRLVDSDGQIVAEATASNDLGLLATMPNDRFVLRDTEDATYFLFSKDGLKELTNMPESLVFNPGSSPRNTPTRIRAYNQNTLIFNACSQDLEGCGVRLFNFESGEEKVLGKETLQKYGAGGMSLSPDRSTFYYLGIDRADLEDLSNKAAELTDNDPFYFENDPRIESLYDETINRTLLSVDIQTGQTFVIAKVPTKYTYYGKFWVTPNGEHMLYSENGELGVLQHFDLTKGQNIPIKLPTDDSSSETWGGSTVTYDPLFSPDGKNVIFPSTRQSTREEYVLILNLDTLGIKEIYSQGSSNYGSVGSARWMTNDILVFETETDNFKYQVSTDQLSDLGANSSEQIVGIPDGHWFR